MNHAALASLCVLLAGCASSPSSLPTPEETTTWTDSPPVQEGYDLSGGIDESWTFQVANPGGAHGVLRFVLSGPSGAPPKLADVCFEFSYTQLTPDGPRSAEGEQGVCGGALSVAPEASAEGEILFQKVGADLLPGSYSFHATGGMQVASLAVEFVPR